MKDFVEGFVVTTIMFSALILLVVLIPMWTIKGIDFLFGIEIEYLKALIAVLFFYSVVAVVKYV